MPTQLEQAYNRGVATKLAQARLSSELLGGLGGAALGGLGGALAQPGWRKRLRNAAIGAGVGGAAGAAAGYGVRKFKARELAKALADRVKAKATDVATDQIVRREFDKVRNGTSARIAVAPETNFTAADLDREAKVLNSSRDFARLREQQASPAVRQAEESALARVAASDANTAQQRADAARVAGAARLEAAHDVNRARFAKERRADDAGKLIEAIDLARDKRRTELDQMSPWRRKLTELLTGLPADQADADPLVGWSAMREAYRGDDKDYAAKNPRSAAILGYLNRNKPHTDDQYAAVTPPSG